MSELLSAEERSALQQSYGAASEASHSVTRATFPSVSQLDANQASDLHSGLSRWMELVARDLSAQLRAPCAARPPCEQSTSAEKVLQSGEEAFWGRIEGPQDNYILISVPRGFAAAICERMFGAPLKLSDDRPLTEAESLLLRDLARPWFGFFARTWEGLIVCPGPGHGDTLGREEEYPTGWLRFSSQLVVSTIESAIHVSMTTTTARLLLDDMPIIESDHVSPEIVARRLGHVPIELRVVLGHASFALDDLASLQVGDVIALDRRSPDPVEIVVDDRTLFHARAGLAGERVAFEILADSKEKART